MAYGAADGAAVPYLRVSDERRRVGDEAAVLLQGGVALHIAVAGHRANGEVIPFIVDVVEVIYAPEVDEDRRGGEPELHYGEQAVAAGEELGLVAVLPEQLDSVVDGFGNLIVEGKGDHDLLPPSVSVLSGAWDGRPERSASRVPASCPCASWIACHTFHGEAGMSMWVIP